MLVIRPGGMVVKTDMDDKDYQLPFPFTGKLDRLTVQLRE
jgi:hypothetical protein